MRLNNEMHEVRTSCLGTLAFGREARKSEEPARANARETGDESIPFPALKKRTTYKGGFFFFISQFGRGPEKRVRLNNEMHGALFQTQKISFFSSGPLYNKKINFYTWVTSRE